MLTNLNSRHRNRNKERIHGLYNGIRRRCFDNQVHANVQVFKLNKTISIRFSFRFAVFTFNSFVSDTFFQICCGFIARSLKKAIRCNSIIITSSFIICYQLICRFNLINSKTCIFKRRSLIRHSLLLTSSSYRTCQFCAMEILINGNRAFFCFINRTYAGFDFRCLGIAFALGCHCWHGAQTEGQGGAQQACEKTFCFFHFSTSSLKKNHHRMGGGAARLKGSASARRAVRGAAAGKRCRAARTVP